MFNYTLEHMVCWFRGRVLPWRLTTASPTLWTWMKTPSCPRCCCMSSIKARRMWDEWSVTPRRKYNWMDHLLPTPTGMCTLLYFSLWFFVFEYFICVLCSSQGCLKLWILFLFNCCRNLPWISTLWNYCRVTMSPFTWCSLSVNKVVAVGQGRTHRLEKDSRALATIY